MWLELGTKHQKTLMKDPKTPQWNMAALCRTALAALAALVALAPRSVLGENIGPSILPERWGPFVGGVQARVEHTIFKSGRLWGLAKEWIQWMRNPDFIGNPPWNHQTLASPKDSPSSSATL